MGGITLARSEFLVLLDAVQAPALVGMDAVDLVPPSADQHKEIVDGGIEQLKQRGMLTVQDGVHVLDTTLLGMAMVIADPELALITTRDTPAAGGQLFMHYKARELVVEHTLPSEHEHRLALVGETELVDRILEILPLHDGASDSDSEAELPQDAFIEAKDMTEAGETAKASKVLQSQGVDGELAGALLAAMAEPEFGGTLALLRCEKGQVVDARNLAVVQGADTAWLVRQADAGSAQLQVSACDEQIMRSLLSEWIGELSP